MTPGVFAALAATIAVTALIPGPAVTAIVARSISDGAKPALVLNAGVVTGDLLFLTLAAAGMAAAARSMGELFAILRWFGALYLVWQGVVLWRARPRMAEPPVGRTRHEEFWRNYGAGLLLMLGHVQMIVFYAALLPGFVDFPSLTRADFTIVALLVVVVLGGINSAYALLAARARGFFTDERAQRSVSRVAGTLMFVAAVLVVTKV